MGFGVNQFPPMRCGENRFIWVFRREQRSFAVEAATFFGGINPVLTDTTVPGSVAKGDMGEEDTDGQAAGETDVLREGAKLGLD
ncbi:MAG: hypothetical protein EOO38_30950 [Cytophagaceae bacterium]|nr:MAG: hypothetical protein EOO38_30950 [Cytophagaceae bacterium]